MAKKISKYRYLRGMEVGDLGKVTHSILTVYSKELQDRVDKIGHASMAKIVQLTRDTAPFDAQAYHRHFVDQITMKAVRRRASGTTYVWYVKAPCHRLTHLLVHGHETKDGGRTRPDPFLQNAMDKVLPEYVAAIERAIAKERGE